MLTLTRKTDYALIALTHLAREPDGCSSAREIAARYHAPLSLLMNVLKLLKERGLARSVRGPRGGYALAKSPRQITLSNIIQAVEGPIHLVRCVPRQEDKDSGAGKHSCELMSDCPVRSSVHRVHHRLIQFLDEVTLADVVENPSASHDDRAACQTSEVAESEEF